MAENKKTAFIWYYDDMQKLEDLTDAEFGFLFRKAAEYEMTRVRATDIPSNLKIGYNFLCVQLDIDYKKWQLECERRRLAAIKGAYSRWNNDKNANRTNRKQLNQPQLVANASDSMRLLPDTDTDTEPQTQPKTGTEIDAGATLSQNQIKFLNTFPNLEVDGDLLPGQDIDLLIQKIKEAPWLQNRKNLGLKWYAKPKNYKRVISGYYAPDKFDEEQQGDEDYEYLDE